MSDAIAPGWYKDPVDTDVQRYWDGEQWIGTPIPADAAPPATPPVTLPETAPVPALTTPATATSPPPIQVADPARGTPFLVYGRPIAPLSSRFMARFVDVLAVLAMNVVVNGWFVYQWWREIAPTVTETQRWMTGQVSDLPVASERAGNLQLAIWGIGLVLWFAYEVPAQATRGQTLGKRLFEVKVLNHNGQIPGFWSSAGRWAFMAAPFLCAWPLLAPFQVLDSLRCTWDRPLRQCLHDRVLGTTVVQLVPDDLHATQPTDQDQEQPGG